MRTETSKLHQTSTRRTDVLTAAVQLAEAMGFDPDLIAAIRVTADGITVEFAKDR